MKRIRYVPGQLPLIFEMEAHPETTPLPQPEDPPEPVRNPMIKPVPAVKVRTQKAFVCSGPSVTLHKAGRKILVKANDPVAAELWRELRERAEAAAFRNTRYYIGQDEDIPPNDLQRIECWRHLGEDLEQHPFSRVLQSFGVTVFVSDTLRDFMKKEARRQEIENTPFPVTPVETDVRLFDRCSEGTVLRCIKNYSVANSTAVLFKEGERYMVVSTGSEGRDVVALSTEPVRDKAVLSLLTQSKIHEWTGFHPEMEDHFNDSEEHDVGDTLEDKFPELVRRMEAKLQESGLYDKLYEHVRRDVVLMALKRGGINAYPMRMAKTSFSIAWAVLRGYQSVVMVAPRNARIHAVKEFKRMGYVENKDFVQVNSLDDLEKPARFYLVKSTWLRQSQDLAYDKRRAGDSILRPSVKYIRKKTEGPEPEYQVQHQVNYCPHCKDPLYRLGPTHQAAFRVGDQYLGWSQPRGYRCINKACSYKTAGGKRGIKHTGGYIDYVLAAHADCPDEKIRGRMCPTCRQADGVWKPAFYKRLKKLFSGVILDEIHSCKDITTDTAKSSFSLRGRGHLGLSGTLVSNSPMDAYQPLRWSLRGPHSGFPYSGAAGAKEYDNRFCDSVTLEKTVGEETNAAGQKQAITKTVRKRVPFLRNPPDFWRFMSAKVVRRTYKDPLYLAALAAAGMKMPEHFIHKYPCLMDKDQARIMLASIKDFRAQFEKMLKEAAKKNQSLNPALVISQMSILKTVATSPEMLNDKFGARVYKGVPGGGKIHQIYNLTKDWVGKGKKVVILSDFVQMQKTCEEKVKEFNPIRFNVGWDDEARNEAFEEFQENHSAEGPKVFIAGTRAIREGVDLSAADICIACDLLWSPAFQTQAWSRILTPTSRERRCDIYLMVSSNSLDEHIYGVFYSKLVASEQAMDRKVLNRRAQDFDVKWFVERVLEEENAIAGYLERSDDDSSDTMMAPGLDASSLMEREV